jgi:hypothetical protein
MGIERVLNSCIKFAASLTVLESYHLCDRLTRRENLGVSNEVSDRHPHELLWFRREIAAGFAAKGCLFNQSSSHLARSSVLAAHASRGL